METLGKGIRTVKVANKSPAPRLVYHTRPTCPHVLCASTAPAAAGRLPQKPNPELVPRVPNNVPSGALGSIDLPDLVRNMSASQRQDSFNLLMKAGPQAIDKYLYLREQWVNSPSKYYNLLMNYTQEVLPYIYTPTVGQACQEYHILPGLKTRGLYLSLKDKGKILSKLQAWPRQNIRVSVVTDGERILGLGDLGANGMGISEGKIELYTAVAGVDPAVCLPICLDVGTNNAKLREHPAYKGLRQPRPPAAEYDEFVAEFMAALKEWQPHLLLQFEDFGNTNAFRVLDTYKDTHCCFNDDIQGTASISLSALLAAVRVTGARISAQRVLFMGAGEAATGIAQLVSYYIHSREGITMEEARQRCFLIDSKGLVCKARKDLQHHKLPFAHDVPFQPTLEEVVDSLQPTALIGVSAMAGAFTPSIIKKMAALNKDPIILPLSNPTKLAECTYEDAFAYTDGRVVFASGSPFPDLVDETGHVHHPVQANNAYVFPAVGHAAILTKATKINDEVFTLAAQTLANIDTLDEVKDGLLFPPFTCIRDVSSKLMAAVAHYFVDSGLGEVPEGWDPNGDWVELSRRAMWGAAVERL